MKNKIFMVGVIIFCLFFARQTKAGVIINEICPTGCAGTDHQWVEIYNVGTTSVDLSNWKFWENSTKHGLSISSSSPKQSFVLEPSEYAVVTQDDQTFFADYPLFSSLILDSSWGTLNKSGEEIGLKDEADNFVEQFTYKAVNNFSLQRKDTNILASDENNWCEHESGNTLGVLNVCPIVVAETPTTTPTSTPPIETPTTTSPNNTNQLRINEFLPNPESGSEWVEIYNPSTTTFDLAGCKLFDAVGEIAGPTGTIEAGGFLVIELSSSKLNNSGDSIFLKNQGNDLIDSVSFGEIKKGNSFARSVDGAGDFQETTTLTKGVVNIITVPIVNVTSGGGGDSNNNAQEIVEIKEIKNGNFLVGEVVINELVSDPADGEEEFVELYNKSQGEIDLSGWYLSDGGKSKTILSGKFLVQGFFVVEKPKGSLNNSGDAVYLFSPDGKIIDQVIYGDWNNDENNSSVARDPNSLIRKIDGEDTGNDKNDFVITNLITKGASNKISIFSGIEDGETLVSVPKIFGVYISEVLPNPIGLDTNEEFIEIFNSSSSTVDVTNWFLADASNKKFKIPKTDILPKSFLVFKRSLTKISLGNSGEESLKLLDATGGLVDLVEYEDSVPEGQSFSKLESGEWDWTITPTPNAKNIFTKSLNKEMKNSSAGSAKIVNKKTAINSLDKIYETSVGDKVKVQGVVSVLPGIFGSQYFYISSSTCGVQIYMNSKKFPGLKVGDIVQVSGEISEPNGEKRVKIKNTGDIKIIGFTNSAMPVELNTVDLNDSVGALIKVKGEITDIKTTYMYVNDEEGEIKIMFKQGANIAKGELHLGDIVEVIGVVNRSTSGVQLLPRSSADIVKVGVAEKIAEPGIENKVAETYLTATAGGLTSILIGLLAKARGKVVFGLLKKVGSLAVVAIKGKTKV